MKRRHSKPPGEPTMDDTHKDLQELRDEIADTIKDLRFFGEQLKEANRVGT